MFANGRSVREQIGGAAIAALIGLLLAGCSQPDPPSVTRAVDAVVTPQPTPTPTTVTPQPTPAPAATPTPSIAAADDSESDCALATVVDEFGFEIEIEQCDGAESAMFDPPPPIEDVLAGIANDRAQTLARTALQSIKEANDSCSDQSAWSKNTQRAATDVSLLADALEQESLGQDWRGSDGAANLYVAVRNGLVMQSDCVDGADDVAAAETLAAAQVAVASTGELRLATFKGQNGEFWFQRDEIGHLLEIQRILASGSIDILIIGSSTAREGFDPNLMGDRLGASAMNAGVGALLSEVTTYWWDQITELGAQPDTVVIGYAPFEAFVQCDETRIERAERAATLRNLAFSSIPALAAHSSTRRTLGVDPDSYVGGFLPGYEASFGARGDALNSDGVDEVEAAKQRKIYQQRWHADEMICARRVDGIRDMVSAAQAVADRVVVVATPLHSQMRSLHSDGDAGFAEAVSNVKAAVEELDAEHVDLSMLLEDQYFHDLTHANFAGRESLTEALVDALKRE